MNAPEKHKHTCKDSIKAFHGFSKSENRLPTSLAPLLMDGLGRSCNLRLRVGNMPVGESNKIESGMKRNGDRQTKALAGEAEADANGEHADQVL